MEQLNFALISIFDNDINNNYNDYIFNNKKGVPIGIDLNTKDIVYWNYYSPNECHMLIAGATGSGKSVCLDVIINNLIHRKDVELYLQDTKYTKVISGKLPAEHLADAKSQIEEINQV